MASGKLWISNISLVKDISRAHLVCIKHVVLVDRISKGAMLPLGSLLLFVKTGVLLVNRM